MKKRPRSKKVFIAGNHNRK